MSRSVESRCRGTYTAFLCTLVLALLIPALATGSGAHVPRRLIDGSVPHAVPAPLRARGSTFVMTAVRLRTVSQISRRVASCVPGERLPATEVVVERIGVDGRDLTFLGLGSTIEGCDRNPHANGRPWCGGAGWIYRHGRVSDTRLVICQEGHGKPVVAFGWINPLPRAQWIVVDQPGFREVYPVVAHLPVRVTTVSGLSRREGVTFHLGEYDARGVLLARRSVTAAVAS